MKFSPADPRRDLWIIHRVLLAALSCSVNTHSLPAPSLHWTAWADHKLHPPHPRGFGGEGCWPTPHTWILRMEFGGVTHLLGHHILGHIVLPEQTCRVKGCGELTPGMLWLAHSRDQSKVNTPSFPQSKTKDHNLWRELNEMSHESCLAQCLACNKYSARIRTVLFSQTHLILLWGLDEITDMKSTVKTLSQWMIPKVQGTLESSARLVKTQIAVLPS